MNSDDDVGQKNGSTYGMSEPGKVRSTTYGYLSLMRASMDCPEWDDEEGDESLFAGKHPEVWMPRVYSEERDTVVGRRYERVALVELPERMKSDDAFGWARENQPEPLDEWYEDDEPEVVTDGGYPWNVRINLGGVTFEGPGMGSEQEAQAIKEIVESSEPVGGVEVIRQ